MKTAVFLAALLFCSALCSAARHRRTALQEEADASQKVCRRSKHKSKQEIYQTRSFKIAAAQVLLPAYLLRIWLCAYLGWSRRVLKWKKAVMELMKNSAWGEEQTLLILITYTLNTIILNIISKNSLFIFFYPSVSIEPNGVG